MTIPRRSISVVNPDSVIGFERAEYDDGQTYGDDFLTIGGVRVLDLGFDCPSCTIIFRRIDPTRLPMSPQALASALGDGLTELDDPVIDTVRSILPSGDYVASLMRVKPILVFPASTRDYFTNEYWRTTGRDHDPGQIYCRGRSSEVQGATGRHPGEESAFHELIVPLYAPDACDVGRVDEFRALLRGGAVPTALAISLPDAVSQRSEVGDPRAPHEHRLLTHYLLDGHHKVRAAAEEGREIAILSMFRSKSADSDLSWWVDTVFPLLESREQ